MEFRADMHIHSRHSSDGFMSVRKIFDLARKKGLHAVAVADHNVFDGAYEALAAERGDLTVIPAAEISTGLGHMLCYFITKGPAEAGLKKTKGLYDFEEILAFVREEKGLIFAAHPYRKGALEIADVLDRIDGIEVFNGRNTARRQAANDLARELVCTRGLCFCAGSDAHMPPEVGRACRIFHFDAPPSKRELYDRLLVGRGDYFGMYSPLFYEGAAGLLHDVRAKNGKRLIKDLCKTALGAATDPFAGLRGNAKEIHRGKIYRIPDRDEPGTEMK